MSSSLLCSCSHCWAHYRVTNVGFAQDSSQLRAEPQRESCQVLTQLLNIRHSTLTLFRHFRIEHAEYTHPPGTLPLHISNPWPNPWCSGKAAQSPAFWGEIQPLLRSVRWVLPSKGGKERRACWEEIGCVHGEDIKERNPFNGPSGPGMGHTSHDSFSEFEGDCVYKSAQLPASISPWGCFSW